MRNFQNILSSLCYFFAWGGQIAMVILMILTVVNSILGFLWKPIFGTYDLSIFLTAAIVSFLLGYFALNGGDVAVTLIVDKYSLKVKRRIVFIAIAFSAFFALFMTWAIGMYAIDRYRLGDVTTTLGWPIYPLAFIMSFGLFLYFLTYVYEFCDLAKRSEGGKI